MHLRGLGSRHYDVRDLLQVRQNDRQDYTSLVTNEIGQLADYANTAHIMEDVLLLELLLHAINSDERVKFVLTSETERCKESKRAKS